MTMIIAKNKIFPILKLTYKKIVMTCWYELQDTTMTMVISKFFLVFIISNFFYDWVIARNSQSYFRLPQDFTMTKS